MLWRCHLHDRAFGAQMPASDISPWWNLFCWGYGKTSYKFNKKMVQKCMKSSLICRLNLKKKVWHCDWIVLAFLLSECSNLQLPFLTLNHSLHSQRCINYFTECTAWLFCQDVSSGQNRALYSLYFILRIGFALPSHYGGGIQKTVLPNGICPIVV